MQDLPLELVFTCELTLMLGEQHGWNVSAESFFRLCMSGELSPRALDQEGC